MTNLTVASTLVCDPHIQFMPKLARGLGGFVDLSSVPVEYIAGVGNMNQSFVAWMVYNYAVQQARDIVGIFRPYIFFGQATGNAILRSDPNNPASGTVPRSTTDIGNALVRLILNCYESRLIIRKLRTYISDHQAKLGWSWTWHLTK